MRTRLYQSIKAILFVVMAHLAASTDATAQAEKPYEVNLKWKRTDYSVAPIPSGPSGHAVWITMDDASWAASPANAVEVCDHFLQQPEKTRKLGLRMDSHTYLVPLNAKEKPNLTPHLIERHQDAAWRKSESDLIDTLIAECNRRGLPLFVNLSADLKKSPWRLLTNRETLEYLKTLKPTAASGSGSGVN
jgi:hypothetical protein